MFQSRAKNSGFNGVIHSSDFNFDDPISIPGWVLRPEIRMMKASKA